MVNGAEFPHRNTKHDYIELTNN